MSSPTTSEAPATTVAPPHPLLNLLPKINYEKAYDELVEVNYETEVKLEKTELKLDDTEQELEDTTRELEKTKQELDDLKQKFRALPHLIET